MPLEQHEECAFEGTAIEDAADDAISGEEFPRAAPAHTFLQRFTVAYEYPVAFTRDLFSPTNRALVETLAQLEPN